ncbi:protein neuralized-like [Ostrea edulis]|uniref:protein neuralized-like n=1 Tax=Ostrea edulis TaxID=37623 RepID=UPI0024AFD317|nr:protein neuralized-like [Ostrea edulis]
MRFLGWVLVVFLEEDVLSHPIPLEEVEDASGRNGVEADLQERHECRARYYVGERMRRAVIVRRSENREELVNYYTSVMKLEREERTADRKNTLWQYTKMIGGSVVVGGLAVAAAPLALSAAGFSSAGIVAGSLAARLMSMAAIANGGGVAAASAGGWIAALQSAGAAGISATTNLLLGSTAGGLFAMFNRKKASEGNENEGDTIKNMKCQDKKEKKMDLNKIRATKTTEGNQAQDTGRPSEDTIQVHNSDCLSGDTAEAEDIGRLLDSNTQNPETERLYQETLRLQEANQCKICMDSKMNTLFFPCGHLCACQQCAARLRKCPICNKVVRNLHRVYKS